MALFESAAGVLQTLVIALSAGLGVWGIINLLEGYGNDNPGANVRRGYKEATTEEQISVINSQQTVMY